MSEENVELFRRGIEAYNRGDLDTLLALIHPDFEYVTAGLFPGLRPVYRGHEGQRELWRDFRKTWDSLKIEINELHDTGDGRVVALLTWHARSREGLEVHRQFGTIGAAKNGLGVRQQVYGTWSEALEAAGLSE